MNKKVYIIHGWEGKPNSNWFPWLKAELIKKGIEAEIPEMPNANNPDYKEWLSSLKKIVVNPDENTYLVGHSLGAIAILRYLESLPKGLTIGGVIFVAGFPEPIGYNELNSFFQDPLDYEKIKKSAKMIVAVNSDNDPYVPIENGYLLKDKLGAELIIVPKAGHFNEKDGYPEFPLILNLLTNK